ncbi:MAG: hypothetical protein ACYC96_14820 [Fimbriimonadaceae bacterium]
MKLLPAFYAMLDIAENRAHNLTLHASCRDVALRACIGWATAARHIRALVDQEWLVVVEASVGPEAAVYRLGPAPTPRRNDTLSHTPRV